MIYFDIDRVRKEILNILQLPFLRPDLFPAGCSKRRGILLYGPPGKTYCWHNLYDNTQLFRIN